ncbi:MAG: hypothetical protein ACKVKM_09450, partial [Verrucomicrobiia bacterium]
MKKHSKNKNKKISEVVPAINIMQQETTVSYAELKLDNEELIAELEGYDSGSLSRAKTQWFFGEWDKLANLDIEPLRINPDRDKLALLIASAHQQLGKHDETRKYIRMALNWGCPQNLVAKILVAGIHNTLGRASAIKQDNNRTIKHFRKSVRVAGEDSDNIELVSHARSVREMSRLGLLPQVITLLDEQLKKTQEPQYRPGHQRTRIDLLEANIGLLRKDISATQSKEVLHGKDTHKTIEAPVLNSLKSSPTDYSKVRPSQGNPYIHNRIMTPELNKSLQDFFASALHLNNLKPTYIDYLALKAIEIEKRCTGRLATTLQDAVVRQVVAE